MEFSGDWEFSQTSWYLFRHQLHKHNTPCLTYDIRMHWLGGGSYIRLSLGDGNENYQQLIASSTRTLVSTILIFFAPSFAQCKQYFLTKSWLSSRMLSRQIHHDSRFMTRRLTGTDPMSIGNIGNSRCLRIQRECLLLHETLISCISLKTSQHFHHLSAIGKERRLFFHSPKPKADMQCIHFSSATTFISAKPMGSSSSQWPESQRLPTARSQTAHCTIKWQFCDNWHWPECPQAIIKLYISFK